MNILTAARTSFRMSRSAARTLRRQPQLPLPLASRTTTFRPFSGQTVAAAFQPATPPKSLKAKSKPNKSSASLKRTAAESLPIRVNPTPTRGAIQPVFTFSTAERYNLSALQYHLPSSAVMFEEAWWVPSWNANGQEGEVWIFGSGSIVCWGLGENEARQFAEEFLQRNKGVEIGRLEEAETEELEFVTDHAEPTRLQGDLIILGQTPELSDVEVPPIPKPFAEALPRDSAAARYAFSHALSRSNALSALESSLDNYLSSVSRLPFDLSRTGKPALTRQEIIKKLGQLLRLRQQLNLSRESFDDTPDLYWTEPALEGYFNSVSKALEIRARVKSINEKITYAAELQSTLRELLTESTAHRMELIIIALIAVEVVIAFVRDGPELVQAIIGEPEEAPKHK